MQDLILAVIAAAFGGAIGSFLNVCVYRWPNGLSVLEPKRSFCPVCREPIRWHDNVPVLGWVLLRGRCRSCGASISPQYPLVELAVAVIWVAAALRFGATVEAVRSAVFLTLLLGIALTDARHMVIPDQFSLGGAVAGLLLAAAPGGMGFVGALVGAVAGYVLFWLVMYFGEKAFRKPALGLGDVHMMAMIGAFVGWAGVFLTTFLGSLAGLAFAVPAALMRGRGMMGSYLPFGVFLALGAVVAHTWGAPLVAWYRALVGI